MSKRQFQQLRVKFVGKKICWIVDEILLQLLMNFFLKIGADGHLFFLLYFDYQTNWMKKPKTGQSS